MGTKGWIAAAAVAGALAGVAVGGGIAGAFTATGPAVGTGSYPGVLLKASCQAGVSVQIIDVFTVPAGTVFVPDDSAYDDEHIATWGTRSSLQDVASGSLTNVQLNGIQYAAGYGLLVDGARYTAGPVAAGKKIQVMCSQGKAVSNFSAFVRGTLERQ